MEKNCRKRIENHKEKIWSIKVLRIFYVLKVEVPNLVLDVQDVVLLLL